MYDWYEIFNLAEFNALGLESFLYTVYLEDKGLKEILVTKGNVVSVVVDNKFLPISFNNTNPWDDEGIAVYMDADENIWVGYEVEE